MDISDLRHKHVVVMGLGLLGGGVATTRWLVEQGAYVTVTDLKSEAELEPSLQALSDIKEDIEFVLGRHDEQVFRGADFVVVNPGVPKESRYLKIATEGGAEIINDAVLFFNTVSNPIIAITGTRGKTTTTNWIAHFLRVRWSETQAAGNTPDNPLMKEALRLRLENNSTPAVVELSSWQLEHLHKARRGPDVAVITNLYEDHMNRYTSMEEYAEAKANIFSRQTQEQFLVLKKDDRWTPWFLEKKPQSKILYSSSSELRDGVPPAGRGAHNVENLQMASVASHALGMEWGELQGQVSTLPTVRFRQEIVFEKDGLVVVNDSASTAPSAASAALRRFSLQAKEEDVPLFFITGGTDKNLSYEGFAKDIAQAPRIDGLFLLQGSATEKLKKALFGVSLPVSLYGDLESIVSEVKEQVGDAGGLVVFSPGAASFEKFKNEFHRGETFNELVQKYF